VVQRLAGESPDHSRASKKERRGFWNMKNLKRLEDEVSAWPNVSVHPHRFGARQFRFGSAEVGHVHPGGIVDIPFPRPVRDALLAQGLVEEHRWVPNSGWITFQVCGENDFKHAVWLMQLSYLRYALKTAADPGEMLDLQSEELHLSPQLRSLLKPFVSVKATAVLTKPLTT